MGVAGASLATAISKLVSFSILIFPYITRRSLLHLSIKNFHPTWEIITKVISVGSSAMFRTGLAIVTAILLNSMAGNISDSVLAGIGVTNKIMMIPFGIILGFGNGFQPVAGFCWGAKNYDRVQEAYRFSSRIALIGSTLMALFVAVFNKQLITIFAGTDAEMQRIGAFCILTQCIALPIHAWVAIVNMLCIGLGDAKGAFLLSTARQGSCFIPIVFPLAWLFGAMGLASVQALADVLTLALAFPLIIRMMKKIKPLAIPTARPAIFFFALTFLMIGADTIAATIPKIV
jgi:Na+-driven multidrug efflux pump